MNSKRLWFTGGVILLVSFAVSWLLLTSHEAVWPVRNTLQYHLVKTWWSWTGEPAAREAGALRGRVEDEQGRPLAGAWVLVSRWDGTTYSDRSDAAGRYLISDIPAGTYRPVAGTPGYESVRVGGPRGRVTIKAGQETGADVILPEAVISPVTPGRDFSLGQRDQISCATPVESEATRRQVHFISGDRPNQPTFFYTPPTAAGPWPVLLAIYPGPVESWECVSAPLAAAGYAVLGVGPAYSFDLEADVDELERLLNFARRGRFPGGDGDRVAILGGSYSSLHVLRLLQRDQALEAAVLLGPPTDLFDMRRRLENETFIPPFGLDQAFYALGFPSQAPLRYWRYSGGYHVAPDFPPVAIMHSRSDAVVPYQQSEFLADQLAAAGVPFEHYLFEGGGHYLLADDGDSDALEMYEITLDFLETHLK